jgi:hypothetical protein
VSRDGRELHATLVRLADADLHETGCGGEAWQDQPSRMRWPNLRAKCE